MAKIIELYGPPGVGKSTLYHALVAQHQKESNWIASTQLLTAHTRQQLKYDSLKTVVKTFVKRNLGSPDMNMLHAAGERFTHRFPEVVEMLWEDVAANKKAKGRGYDVFRAAALTYAILGRIQLLLESPSGKYALIEEGMAHCLFNTIYRMHKMGMESEAIGKVIPATILPHALIYVTCDAKENAKRLLSRKKRLPFHKGLDLLELERRALRSDTMKRVAPDILESIGMPVLRIDSALPVEANIATILSFLKGLGKKEPVAPKSRIYRDGQLARTRS